MSNTTTTKKIYGVDASDRNTRLLRIRILHAKNLQQQDIVNGLGNPYVKVLLQIRENRNEAIVDIARTQTVLKTINPTWNKDFLFRVDPTKHRLLFEIYNQNNSTKDEFLGMFYIELSSNTPYESVDHPMVTNDYTLLQRSTLERASGNATVGLCYIEDRKKASNRTDSVESTEPLPSGWEERKDPTGRTYYINHNTRTTTWIRPNGQKSSTTSTSTNKPTDDFGPLPPGWKMMKNQNHRIYFIDQINQRTTWVDPRTGRPSPEPVLVAQTSLLDQWEMRTLADGRVYYIDHINKKTSWTDPRTPGPTVPRDYEEKHRIFRQSLPRSRANAAKPIEIHIDRKDVRETSYRAVMSIKDPEILKISLKVVFDGEQRLNNDDLVREWFLILSREMFNPHHDLFEYSAINNYILQINPNSGFILTEHEKYFRFIGRIIAMAIYHNKLLETFFIRPFYKMLLSKPITLADIESVDREYYRSLKYIADNDPTDLDLYFVISEEELGELREYELKLNGQQTQVTEQNKKQYLDLVIHYRFAKRITKQMDALKQGFQEIFPLDTLKMFDEQELERLISGLGEINVNDWRTHTTYKGGYTSDDPVIQNFWKAIDSFNTKERKDLLQFVTGASCLPVNGFRDLWCSSGPQLFTIEKWDDKTKLPRAHKDFNCIELPPYDNYEDLRQKLLQAID